MNHVRKLFWFAAVASTFAQAATSQPVAERPLAIGAADAELRWGPCPPIYVGKCEIAVLHGDPAKPNADVFLRVSGGTELTPHTHSSAERMVLVSGRLEVKYLGSPAATLTVGRYAYGPAGLPHRAKCIGRTPCTLFIAFEGPVDTLPHKAKLD